MEFRPRIFLSYASSDFDVIESLYERLLEEGFSPWMDKSNALSGVRPKADTQEAIRTSDFFLACLSNNAVSENGTLAEEIRRPLDFLWKSVSGYSYLIPVRLDECPIPESLIAFDPIDLFDGAGWVELLRVIERVKADRSGIIENPLGLNLSVFGARMQESMGESNLEGPDDPSSVRKWGINLRRLLNGERESILLRLGGVVEYIEVMLAEAEDQAAANEAFHEALGNLVQTWQPSVIDSNYYLNVILDLIGAYTPRVGFNKIVDFIQRQKYFSQSEPPYEDGDVYKNLYLKALVVLENYYRVPPLPPEDTAPAYQVYINILQEDFLRPEYTGYALKRMIQLRVIQLDSPRVDELIRRNPQSLTEMLNLLLDPNRRSTARQDLGLVYTACLEAGSQVERHFEEAVIACGGHLERKEDGPVVILEDAAILLNLPQEVQYKYWALFMEREEQKGRMKYEAMSG